MEHILIYGKEHTFLEPKTGLLFRNSSLKETASIHTHTFYEFFIVTSGSALHLVNQSIQTITKGDIIFIRPKDTHSYGFYYSDDFRIVNIGFSTQLFQDIQIFYDHTTMLQSLLDTELPPCIHVDDENCDYITSNFLEIGQMMKTPDIQKTIFYAKSCLAKIFSSYFFHYSTDTSMTSCPSWFTFMVKEMQRIENLKLGYLRMLELSPCSPNHLSRLFRQIMSSTPTEYINNKRLEYSVYLLTQTGEDILEISLFCGFSSLSHYYHLFKKKYNCSPAVFRKEQKSIF
jgi:AraC family cel operon transcriptional repressor